MSDDTLDLALDELTSAEDFLNYFGIDYDPAVVQVNRLHILQRFHDLLAGLDLQHPESMTQAAALLNDAYNTFVHSNAQNEKVFRVFQRQTPQPVQVSLTTLMESRSDATAKI